MKLPYVNRRMIYLEELHGVLHKNRYKEWIEPGLYCFSSKNRLVGIELHMSMNKYKNRDEAFIEFIKIISKEFYGEGESRQI